MTISDYSSTAGSNTSTPPNGAPENMAPGDVNDVIRQQMADHRLQWNDGQWFEYKDGTANGVGSFVGSNQFKITGNDATSHYHIGRRVKIVGISGTVYGSITAVSYGLGATTVTIDASLTNEALTVYSSLLSSDNDAIPREVIQDIIGAMLTGNTETGITVTYDDADGTIDFVVSGAVSEENFTTVLKAKLDGVAASANNYTHPSTHAISEVSGLQAALDGKAASSHSHSAADLTSGLIPAARYATTANAFGARTVSTLAPSGGVNGDVWYRY